MTHSLNHATLSRLLWLHECVGRAWRVNARYGNGASHHLLFRRETCSLDYLLQALPMMHEL
jgi:hypothetical protein